MLIQIKDKFYIEDETLYKRSAVPDEQYPLSVPRWPVKLDRNNPLTRGLVGAFLTTGPWGRIDLSNVNKGASWWNYDLMVFEPNLGELAHLNTQTADKGVNIVGAASLFTSGAISYTARLGIFKSASVSSRELLSIGYPNGTPYQVAKFGIRIYASYIPIRLNLHTSSTGSDSDETVCDAFPVTDYPVAVASGTRGGWFNATYIARHNGSDEAHDYYIDGKLRQTQAVVGKPHYTSSTGNLILGLKFPGQSTLHLIHNRRLSDGEIAELHRDIYQVLLPA